MKRPRCPLILVVFLIGLVTTFDLQASYATVNIVWRFVVLSFDNPATQWLDELASDTTPCADPSDEARGWIRPALCRRLSLEGTFVDASSPTLGSGFTRSPPGT